MHEQSTLFEELFYKEQNSATIPTARPLISRFSSAVAALPPFCA
jgi:hypothetical protein